MLCNLIRKYCSNSYSASFWLRKLFDGIVGSCNFYLNCLFPEHVIYGLGVCVFGVVVGVCMCMFVCVRVCVWARARVCVYNLT